ncbi:MAG: ComF family protein [bacterium]
MKRFQQLLDAVLPDTCVLCENTVTTSQPHRCCPYCWAALPRIINACRHCALPVHHGEVCGSCQRNPLFPGTCLAALSHTDSARTLVHQLKYSQGLRHGCTLACALEQQVTLSYSNKPLVQAIIPVPLSYWRQVSRGFNQAAWLAHLLGKSLHLPVLADQVRRNSRGAPGGSQKDKNRSSRLQLQAASFYIRRPLAVTHVAIVDDVLTTGATANALARQLRKAGVEKVDIWCTTRTPRPV